MEDMIYKNINIGSNRDNKKFIGIRIQIYMIKFVTCYLTNDATSQWYLYDLISLLPLNTRTWLRKKALFQAKILSPKCICRLR